MNQSVANKLAGTILRGGAFSLCASTILTLVMTLWGWIENPSLIFHNKGNTNWEIVLETAFSWFWPSLPYFLLAALAYMLLKQFAIHFKSKYKNARVLRRGSKESG